MLSRWSAVVVVAALVLSGCSSDDGTDDGTGAPAPSTSATPDLEYVALGDSYAAAPGVPETSGVDGCFRSSGNYAHLVAAARDDVALTDLTCSGATTSDVVENQVPGLSGSTDVVTIGVGGNDFGLFTEVLSGCLGGLRCPAGTATRAEDLNRRIAANVGRTLDAVVAAAPAAEVVVVGYPRLVPASGGCPELPLDPGDLPLVDDVNRGLTDALRRPAQQRGLAYLDVYAASEGHDICAAEPWVNGAEVAPDGTIPFHPFAAEQEAVAEMVLEALPR